MPFRRLVEKSGLDGERVNVEGGCSTSYHAGMRVTGQRSPDTYRREMAQRRTIVEGVFASWDRLGWAKSRIGGIRKLLLDSNYVLYTHLDWVEQVPKCRRS